MLSHFSNRIAVLDGLRAMAIVFVLLRHSVRPFWSDLSTPYIPIGGLDLGAIFINGWVGVDLFFVLSGFLISSHLIRSFEKRRTLWSVLYNYAPRRFFRIAPVYYLVLTLAVFGAFPYFPYPESYEGIGWRYAYHLVFMQDYWPSDIIAVFWSLAIEIKFYLLAPFLIWGVLKLSDDRARIAVIGLLICSQPLARGLFAPEVSGYEEYFLFIRTRFDWCLDGLLMGMLSAFLVHSAAARTILLKPVVSGALFFFGVLLILGLSLPGPLVDLDVSRFDIVWLAFLISAGFAAMLLGLLGECPGHGLFEKRGFSFIALISYSLYLVHLPLLYLAEVMAERVVDFADMSERMGYVVYLPFFVVLCVFVSTLLYVFVERPFIVWSKKKYSRKAEEGEEADDVGDGGQKDG